MAGKCPRIMDFHKVFCVAPLNRKIGEKGGCPTWNSRQLPAGCVYRQLVNLSVTKLEGRKSKQLRRCVLRSAGNDMTQFRAWGNATNNQPGYNPPNLVTNCVSKHLCDNNHTSKKIFLVNLTNKLVVRPVSPSHYV